MPISEQYRKKNNQNILGMLMLECFAPICCKVVLISDSFCIVTCISSLNVLVRPSLLSVSFACKIKAAFDLQLHVLLIVWLVWYVLCLKPKSAGDGFSFAIKQRRRDSKPIIKYGDF
jgi:hypothetical protein